MPDRVLNGLRIGCVPYLNARPLVRGIEEHVTFEVPALLADRFAGGDYDVALLPVFEAFRQPEAAIVDGVSISCLGAVRSVILAHRDPLEDVAEIVLDPASRTSANLLRILLAERFRLAPRLVSETDNPHSARLIIGDPALAFQSHRPSGWRLLDLGQAWHEWIGLPFVFAVWVLRPGLSFRVAAALRDVAANGIAHRGEIAAREADPAAALAYLTRHIRHTLGSPEKQAMTRFRHLLKKNALLDPDETAHRFV